MTARCTSSPVSIARSSCLLVSFSRGDGRAIPTATESLVTVEFIERDAETEIVLTHEGLTTDQDRDGHRHGWVGCLEKLAAAV